MSTVLTDRERDPDESCNLKDVIAEVVADPDAWLSTPNDQLGGYRPEELIGTEREGQLRELARSIKIGMPT